MPTRLQFSKHHYWEIESAPGHCRSVDTLSTVDPVNNYCLNKNGARFSRTDQIAINPFAVYHDHWNALVNTGQFWTGYASVGQRAGIRTSTPRSKRRGTRA